MNFELVRCALKELQFNRFGFTKEDVTEAILDVNELEFSSQPATLDPHRLSIVAAWNDLPEELRTRPELIPLWKALGGSNLNSTAAPGKQQVEPLDPS